MLYGIEMDHKKLIGLTAASKDNKKLGNIIKIEDIVDKKTKIPKPHALILVKKFLRTDIVIVMELSKILKSNSFHAWFDISKKDFDQEVRETRALMYLCE